MTGLRNDQNQWRSRESVWSREIGVNLSRNIARGVAPQDPSGKRSRMRRVINHRHAVDQNGGAIAAGILMRIIAGRAIPEIRWVGPQRRLR
jgi:hypothetical protein